MEQITARVAMARDAAARLLAAGSDATVVDVLRHTTALFGSRLDVRITVAEAEHGLRLARQQNDAQPTKPATT